MLKWNIFEFEDKLYQQKIGTAIGTKCAPNVADIFMAIIDSKIHQTAETFGLSLITFLRRFLDDIMMIWTGTITQLHLFINKINEIHPSIKFTLSHTKPPDNNECDCESSNSIPFLDTKLSIKDNKICSDLYRKPTDKNQYLLPQSCHPPHCTDNIPFSLALRIVRICSEPESRDLRLSELKEMLLARNYKTNIINNAISRALDIPRSEAIKRVVKNKKPNRPVFVITYDPRLPSVSKIVQKHYRTMVASDPHLKEVFPEPPLIAYKHPPNLRNKLIRAKVPKVQSRPRRILKGSKPCNKPCDACPFVETTKTVKSTATNILVDINVPITCETTWVVYVVTCQKRGCGLQYVGKTERTLGKRLLEHKGYIENKMFEKATGFHFSTNGHEVSDMTITVLEKIYNRTRFFIEEREREWIRKFNSKYKGINRSC